MKLLLSCVESFRQLFPQKTSSFIYFRWFKAHNKLFYNTEFNAQHKSTLNESKLRKKSEKPYKRYFFWKNFLKKFLLFNFIQEKVDKLLNFSAFVGFLVFDFEAENIVLQINFNINLCSFYFSTAKCQNHQHDREYFFVNQIKLLHAF